MLEILISVRELQDLAHLSYVRRQGGINPSQGSYDKDMYAISYCGTILVTMRDNSLAT